MALISTRFDVGDTVYHAEVTTDRSLIQCPDCLGTAKWKAILPNGEEDAIECPSCRSGYCSTGTISEYEPRGEVRVLTIGQVGVDEDGPRYMCEETGVGSGRLYKEADLFATREEADAELPSMLSEAKRLAADRGLNEYRRKKGDSVGCMTGYYRKQIRDAKKKLEQAQRGLDRIRAASPQESPC